MCSICICASRYGTSGFPLLPLLPPLPPTPSAAPPSMETANGRAAAIPLANTARGWCQFCRFLRRTIPNSRQAQLGNDFRRFDGVHGRSLSARRPAACCLLPPFCTLFSTSSPCRVPASLPISLAQKFLGWRKNSAGGNSTVSSRYRSRCSE